MGRPIKKGSTDQSTIIRIIDSTDFTPENSVDYDTSGIDLWYRREGATKTSITEAALAALDSAHSDGGIEHIGDGYYRLDLPDAAVASGANGVQIGGAVTGMIVIGNYHTLVDYDPYDAVRIGITALPNAAADAAGGLPISDAGGLDMDGMNSNITSILADTNELQTDDTPGALAAIDAKIDVIDGIVDSILVDTGTTLQGELDGIQADTEDIQTQIGAAGAGLTAIPWNAAWDAEVQSECTDALNAYDPPTKAELDTAVSTIRGADSDTLKTLSDQIDGIGGDATAANQTTIIGHLTDIKGAGWTDETMESLQTAIEGIGGLTGSNSVTLTIQAPSGTNIVGATVDVFDSGNTTFIGRVTTNSSGQAVFSLDDGTYTIRIIKAGYTFSNQTLVVNGTEAETYTGTAYTPASPSEASICRVYEYAYNPDGTPMARIKAFAKINTLPYDANSVLYAGQNITAEYNSTTGLLYWDLVQGSSVKFKIEDLGIDVTETIPASSTVRLSDI